MYKRKIFDCITFYDENLLVNSRFEILDKVVDYFVIAESNYDHNGNKKKINFKLDNLKFKKKIRHIVIEEKFPRPEDGWHSESFQREKLYMGIEDAKDDDLIMFSDSDEIPNPNELANFSLKEKYAIFMQKFFVYKINVFNQYESPWEGTRICKKKNLKSFTHLRKKILKKNLTKSFWKVHIEKNIRLINEGGWHFNNLYPANIISKKLQVFPHREYSNQEYYDLDVINNKIKNLEDLYKRGHKYKKININDDLPNYFFKNISKFKEYFLKDD